MTHPDFLQGIPSDAVRGAGQFTYSNVNDRAPSRLLRAARRVFPGIDHVEREIAPYAASWHTHNITALGERTPLWVALGDSLSQGVGATSIEQSWVLQARTMLAAHGLDYRVVNLSISGARVMDVVEREIPAMAGLGSHPALVTVLVGSNDMVRHAYREELLDHYAILLAALPRGALVAVADRPFGALSAIADLVRKAAASGAVRAVPARLSTRDRAEDHFHLNDHGYRLVAEDFVAAITVEVTARQDHLRVLHRPHIESNEPETPPANSAQNHHPESSGESP